MSKHSDFCSAPLCQENCPVNAVWYPGEEVCLKQPYTKWQKKQLDINKWVSKGKYTNLETPLNRLDLETRSL